MNQQLPVEVQERRLRQNIFLVFFVRLLTITTGGLLAPVLALYVTGKNVPDSQFFLLQAAFHLTALFFDLPFGYLADRYGRKPFVVFGALLLLGGAVCYALSKSLSGFFAAEILLALGQAAIFGAEQAILRSSLERLDRSAEFQRIWGYALSLEMGAASLTTIASGYLFAWHESAPFFVEAILYALLFFISLRLYEVPHERVIPTRSKTREILSVVDYCLKSNPWVRWIVLATSAWSALMISSLWCQSKLLLAHGVETKNIGWYFAALNIAAGAVGLFVARRKKSPNTLVLTAACVLGLMLGFFLSGLVPIGNSSGAIVLIGFLFIQFVRGGSRVYVAGWLKEELPTEFHATGCSINTAVNRLGFVLLAFAVFPFLDNWTAQEKFLVLGMISAFSGALLLCGLPKRTS